MRGKAQEWQTSLEMNVALGRDGTAVIRNHRQSAMGIRLEVIERVTGNRRANNRQLQNQQENQQQTPVRISPKLRISLRNQSDHEISLLDTVEHCAFQLVSNKQNTTGIINTYSYMELPRRQCGVEANWMVHSLQPKEIYFIEIELSDPMWFVLNEDKEQEQGSLRNNWAGYRWIYQLPKELITKHENNEALWSSSLRTAHFTAGGIID